MLRLDLHMLLIAGMTNTEVSAIDTMTALTAENAVGQESVTEIVEIVTGTVIAMSAAAVAATPKNATAQARRASTAMRRKTGK